MKVLARVGVVVAATAGISVAALAQPAEKPKLSVGDKWVFNQSTADGKTTTWSREVVEIPSGEHVRVRLGNGNVADYDGVM